MVNRGELTYGQDVNAIKILQKRKKPNYPTVSNDQSFDNKETSMLYSPLAVVKNNKQMEGLVLGGGWLVGWITWISIGQFFCVRQS